MTKNKLEKFFSESYKLDNRIMWGIKLHNNPLAHQTTPADYMLHYRAPYIGLIAVLIECKQVTLDERGKGRLQIKRLKQLGDMCRYVDVIPDFHRAFFVIGYKEMFWRNSDIYLIPAKHMKNIIENWNKESFNREDAKELFKDWKCEVDKTINMSKIYD